MRFFWELLEVGSVDLFPSLCFLFNFDLCVPKHLRSREERMDAATNREEATSSNLVWVCFLFLFFSIFPCGLL